MSSFQQYDRAGKCITWNDSVCKQAENPSVASAEAAPRLELSPDASVTTSRLQVPEVPKVTGSAQECISKRRSGGSV